MTELQTRLQKLLLILSYVRRHPGVALAELSRAVGLSESELRRAISQLSLCGKPPFDPDDLIDIFIDQDERVHIEFDQALGRPLALTGEEIAALTAALDGIANSPAGPYAATARLLLDKLKSASKTRGEREPAVALTSEDRSGEERFEVLARGVEERRVVEMVYFTPSRDQLTRRRLSPYALLELFGWWYVVGHDDHRNERRIFKLARIREAILTDERFLPPPDFDARKYAERGLEFGPARATAQLRLFGERAEEIADSWDPSALTRAEDGSLTLFIPYSNPDWLANWVFSLGDGVEVLAPEEVKRALLERARATLAHYAMS